MILEKVFRLFVNFFIGILVINFLGPEKYGQISYAITIVFILEIFVYLGLDSVIVKKLVDAPQNGQNLISHTISLKFIVSSVISLCWLFIILLNQKQFPPAIHIPLIVVVLLKPLESIDLFFQANQLNTRTAYIRTFSLIFLGVFNVVLLLKNANYSLFIFPFIVERILTVMLFYIYYHKGGNSLFSKIDFKQYLVLLKEGMFLFLSGIAYIINIRLDVLLIEHFLGYSNVGIYTAATKITESLFLLPSSILIVLFPLMIKRYDDKKYLLKLIGPVGIILASLSIVISMLSSEIINLMYSSDFNESAKILSIHSFVLVMIYLDGISVRLMVIQNRYHFAFIRSLTMVLIGVFINLFLLPVFGIIVSAWSILVVYFVGFVFTLADQIWLKRSEWTMKGGEL